VKKLLIVLLCLLISGCASAPQKTADEQLGVADYGPYPSNYEELIKEVLSPKLVDPYSTVYNLTVPKKGRNSMTGKTIYGWNVCGTVNSKNKFGGYAGASPVYAMINNGRVVRFLYKGVTIPDSFTLGLLSGAMDKAGSSDKYCPD